MMVFSLHYKQGISLLTAVTLLLGNLGAGLPLQCSCQMPNHAAERCACCSGNAHDGTTTEPKSCCGKGQSFQVTEPDNLPDGVRSLSLQGELCTCSHDGQPIDATIAESLETARVQLLLTSLVSWWVADPPIALQAGPSESEPSGTDYTLPLRVLLCVWRT